MKQEANHTGYDFHWLWIPIAAVVYIGFLAYLFLSAKEGASPERLKKLVDAFMYATAFIGIVAALKDKWLLGDKVYHIRYNNHSIIMISLGIVICFGILLLLAYHFGVSALSDKFAFYLLVFVGLIASFFQTYTYEIRTGGIVMGKVCYRWDAIERIDVSEEKCVVTLKKGQPYTDNVNLFVYGKEALLKRLRGFVEVSDERCESARRGILYP